MSGELAISIGQYSDKGRKSVNQDFHGALIPREPLLGLKGIAIVLADGISSSEVSRIASETAVKSVLTDYYCTPDTWSVKLSAQRVIVAANSWLHGQTRQSHPYERDKGYVCTLSALVIRASTAHIFHVGDARIYRVVGKALEQLTEDHRVVISQEHSYLGRALGVNQQVEVDYRAVALERGDTFVLATDGVHEHVNPHFIAQTVSSAAGDLDAAARLIGEQAYKEGSPDNLTVQIVRVDELSESLPSDFVGQSVELPPPPILDARAEFDGYEIVREIHASSRSHIYLAIDRADGTKVALKAPSIDLQSDSDYLRRFRLEEWVARRVDSAHVLRPRPHTRRRNYLYIATEFIDGQTLAQWINDNPKPSLQIVRAIVEQIAKALQAFHRMEMIHQDVRPANIMIDANGTAKIIDFGSTEIAGIADDVPKEILGTEQYSAPEYFLGEGGTARSDLFSLGVIAYQMLTGRLPYGTDVAKARTRSAQRRLRYRSAVDENSDIPAWVDGALRKAVEPDPARRYGELSEFLFDLRHPRSEFQAPRAPLAEGNPVVFWQIVAALLAIVVVALLFKLRLS